MNQGNVERERDMLRRIEAVASCKSTRFVDILEAAEIDPKSELRFGNFSGLSFEGQDLRGFDFTGANLCHCDFSGALIEEACFDQARLGRVERFAGSAIGDSASWTHVAELNFAKDWKTFRYSDWERARSQTSDDHLPVRVVFQDAIRAPQCIVLPASIMENDDRDHDGRRIAVSRYWIGNFELRAFSKFRPGPHPAPVSVVTKAEAEQYCDDLSQKLRRRYRLPTRDELIYACATGGQDTTFDFRQPNAFGIWAIDEDRSKTFESFPLDFTSKFKKGDYGAFSDLSEWCADSDFPIQLFARPEGAADGKGSRAGKGPRHEAGFHVVRELARIMHQT